MIARILTHTPRAFSIVGTDLRLSVVCGCAAAANVQPISPQRAIQREPWRASEFIERHSDLPQHAAQFPLHGVGEALHRAHERPRIIEQCRLLRAVRFVVTRQHPLHGVR